MNGICKFPGCTERAEVTFALLGLCEAHNEAIRIETFHYYTKHPNAADRLRRPLFQKIEMDIPWSRARMGKVDV